MNARDWIALAIVLAVIVVAVVLRGETIRRRNARGGTIDFTGKGKR